MFLTLRAILQARFVVRVIVRGLAVCMLLWAGYKVASLFIDPVVFYTRNIADANANPGRPTYPPSMGLSSFVYRTMELATRNSYYVLAGVALLFLQTHIARWIIPLPLWKCPKCDHEVADPAAKLCTECGLVFTLGGGSERASQSGP